LRENFKSEELLKILAGKNPNEQAWKPAELLAIVPFEVLEGWLPGKRLGA
jgi:hypothetical protein